MDSDKILDKVRKLLALGSSPNEAEAALAIQKAHDLLAAYNLALSDVGPGTDDIHETVLAEGQRLRAWKTHLSLMVARANFCDLLIRKARVDGKVESRVCLVGKLCNCLAARMMIDYLLEAIARMANDYFAIDRLARESYTQGLAMNLSQRLNAIVKEDSAPGSAIHALVVSEHGKIQAYLAAIAGLRQRYLKQSVGDSNSFAQGQRDGDSISLSKQVSGQHPGHKIALPG